MILSEVRNYLAEHRRAALTDMVRRFDADAEALRVMLDLLERKGRVRRVATGPACDLGCAKCGAAPIEVFEWVDPTSE